MLLLNNDWAYLFGAFLGDGTVCKWREKKRFQFSSIDIELTDKVSNTLEILGFRVYRDTYKKTGPHKIMYRVTCYDQYLCGLLLKETDSKNKVPDKILNTKLFVPFFSALMDSEGWVGKSIKENTDTIKYSIGINMTSEWLIDVMHKTEKYGLKVCKMMKPKIIKPHHKQKYWFQFNIKSFINSPFCFIKKRSNERLQEYEKRQSELSAKKSINGKKGAEARWNK